jgi:hypothetical protein
MSRDDHTAIRDWTEDDLTELPTRETDDYEYKSSRLREGQQYRNELKHKLCRAASAFWNTGGGILIAGVDDNGQIDGGLPATMGRQKLGDWVDQSLNQVVPVGPYSVKTVSPTHPASPIEPGHVVLVVAFGESHNLPHMAPDHRYYVRAGAHSNPANHYLVEAIRSRRGLRRPMLRGLIREQDAGDGLLELVVVAVLDFPALDVIVSLDPVPEAFARMDFFPLRVPLIDPHMPFRVSLGRYENREALFGKAPIHITLEYGDTGSNRFFDRQLIDYRRSISPIRYTGRTADPAMERIADQLERLNNWLDDSWADENVSLADVLPLRKAAKNKAAKSNPGAESNPHSA